MARAKPKRVTNPDVMLPSQRLSVVRPPPRQMTDIEILAQAARDKSIDPVKLRELNGILNEQRERAAVTAWHDAMSRAQMASLTRARKYPPRVPQTDCPVCHAQPGEYCKNRNGERSRYAHSMRGRPAESAMPDLRDWWKSMARFEGQYAEPRPDWLRVP